MTIHLATDHAGFAHKEAVKAWLSAEGFEVVDHGAFEEDATDDYPDYISKAARQVSVHHQTDRALIFGGSGQGEAMQANRFLDVRAAVYYGGEDTIVRLSREHNDANVLSIGARFVAIDEAKRVIWDWLHTDFNSAEKYARRNQKIDRNTREFYV